jgi:large subunit ribosomal protein L5
MNYVSRLKKKYCEEIVPNLIKKFTYTSKMAVPCLKKIVVNVGVGDAISNHKFLDDSMKELELITGQHPIITYAKKSIATFKLRAGQAIGCKVTLRRNKMYDFFDKLINIVLPRVRDFRGLSLKSFDGNGNYSIGIKEQIIFPEINYDQVSKVRGMDIVIVTTANTNDEAKELLSGFGVPFSNK